MVISWNEGGSKEEKVARQKKRNLGQSLTRAREMSKGQGGEAT